MRTGHESRRDDKYVVGAVVGVEEGGGRSAAAYAAAVEHGVSVPATVRCSGLPGHQHPDQIPRLYVTAGVTGFFSWFGSGPRPEEGPAGGSTVAAGDRWTQRRGQRFPRVGEGCPGRASC